VAYIAKNSNQSHKERFENIFSSSGPIRWVNNEDLIHKTTALSGSGPAYFFLFIEALAKAGQNAGLSEEQAMDLSIDTLIGASALIEQDRSPEKLRESVTSKGGTTAAALSVFMSDNNLDDLVSEALIAAEKRSREL
jgi:pyrroline-5-carboxylate reductase